MRIRHTFKPQAPRSSMPSPVQAQEHLPAKGTPCIDRLIGNSNGTPVPTRLSRVWPLVVLPICLLAQSCLFIKDIPKPDAGDLLLSLFLGNVENRVGVVSTDLGPSGRFTILRPDGLAVPYFTPIHSDAKARFLNSRVFIMNALGRDSIQILDPSIAFMTIQEYSTGSTSNPQDMVIANGKGYISTYNRSSILIVQPDSGLALGAVNLSAFADADGYPEVAGLHAEGNTVFAVVQRLDRNSGTATWPPSAGYPSLLLEINTTTDSVVATYTMPFNNPFGRIHRVDLFGDPHLVFACPAFMGFNHRIDGGIVAFNLTTRSFRPQPLYSEAVAGGDLLDVVIRDDTAGYAVVEYADFSSSLQRFNPAAGSRVSTLAFYPAWGGYVSGLLITPDGHLYAGDSSYTDPGVMIYDTGAADAPLTPYPVPAGLRPTDMVYIP